MSASYKDDGFSDISDKFLLVSFPSIKSRLIINDSIILDCTKEKPNWIVRLAQKYLLGFTWEDVK